MRAFTLIESLIYIALFGILISGTFTGVSAISESADRNQTKALLESEGNFLMAKIEYGIENATSTNSNLFPLPSTASVNVEKLSFESIQKGTRISLQISATSSSGQVLSQSFSDISYPLP